MILVEEGSDTSDVVLHNVTVQTDSCTGDEYREFCSDTGCTDVCKPIPAGMYCPRSPCVQAIKDDPEMPKPCGSAEYFCNSSLTPSRRATAAGHYAKCEKGMQAPPKDALPESAACTQASCPDCDGSASILCPSGHTCKNGVAEQCASGFYQEEMGQSHCLECPAGYQSQPDKVTCKACPRGTYAARKAALTCRECGFGKYRNVTAATRCADCSAGQFTDAPAQIVCKRCPAGFAQARASGGKCHACLAGQYASAEGSTTCAVALPGSFAEGRKQSASVLCAPGRFVSTREASACTMCGMGRYCPHAGQCSGTEPLGSMASPIIITFVAVY